MGIDRGFARGGIRCAARLSSWLFTLSLGLCLVPASAHRHHADARYSARNEATRLANCPVAGDARWVPARALNRLKRRMSEPSAGDIDPRTTLAALLAPGEDAHRWSERRAASVVGYVAAVKVGGIESVNCHTRDPLYRDTHIELTLHPLHDSQAGHVIVEVTPQWRERLAKQGIDWSTASLRRRLLGRWVRVTGWLLFDFEHAGAATNTASRPSAHIWRATAWEIHPVTRIEVLPARAQRLP